MAELGAGAQPAGIPNHHPHVPPRKARSGCRTVAIVLLVLFVVCGAVAGVGVWYVWQRWSGAGAGEGNVGLCFPAGPDGPLDTSHGTVSCSHPNAMWRITKSIDGRHNGDVIGTCGPDGDALTYIAEEDRSYCLDNIN